MSWPASSTGLAQNLQPGSPQALRVSDGAELALVSEEFERMGDLVAAVDAAAHAAAAHRAQGMRGSALGCAARAQALAERCGGASTPALLQAAEPLPLTDRQREIVMLLGDGLSTRAVAERLSVSVRTVEGHIYRAMEKTGVASRDDLAALLRRQVPAWDRMTGRELVTFANYFEYAPTRAGWPPPDAHWFGGR